MGNIASAPQADNKQKYENYKEQFGHLNLALKHHFNLEAVFIAYAIMEDRTESVLRHAGKYEAYIKSRKGHTPTIDSKIRYIQKLAEPKKELLNKYFADELLDQILEWKENRNRLIHALLKQKITTADLEEMTYLGANLANDLRNRVRNYNRVMERQNRKFER